MVDEEQEQGPPLELPSFGLRRRWKMDRPEASVPEPEPIPEPEPTPAPPPVPEPGPDPEIVPPNEPMSPPIAPQAIPAYAPAAVATKAPPEAEPEEGQRKAETPRRDLSRPSGLSAALPPAWSSACSPSA